MRIGRLRVVATITLDDGTQVVTPDDERPFDRVLFERRFGESWPPLSEDDTLGVTDDHLLYMAWVQTSRDDLAAHARRPEDFDTWLLRVVDVDVDVRHPEVEEDAGGPPTPATPSTGA